MAAGAMTSPAARKAATVSAAPSEALPWIEALPLAAPEASRARNERLLVVDDEQPVLDALRRCLRRKGFRPTLTTSCEEALRLVGREPYAVVITDQRMPWMEGTELLARVRQIDPDAVRILLTGYMEFNIARDAVNRGAAFRLLTKPWREEDLLRSVEEAIQHHDLLRERGELQEVIRRHDESLRRLNKTLDRRVEERTAEIDALRLQVERRLLDTIRVLGSLAELHSNVIGSHSRRVAALAKEVSLRVGVLEVELHDIECAAILHDIGKVGIPNEILRKPEAELTKPEAEALRSHVVHGERILRAIPGMEKVALLVRHHHERFDGGGYPDALGGRDIPLGSRIIAAVDAYDRERNTRFAFRSVTPQMALRSVTQQCPARFDPDVVRALQACVVDRISRKEEGEEMEIRLRDLEPGMILHRR